MSGKDKMTEPLFSSSFLGANHFPSSVFGCTRNSRSGKKNCHCYQMHSCKGIRASRKMDRIATAMALDKKNAFVKIGESLPISLTHLVINFWCWAVFSRHARRIQLSRLKTTIFVPIYLYSKLMSSLSPLPPPTSTRMMRMPGEQVWGTSSASN